MDEKVNQSDWPLAVVLVGWAFAFVALAWILFGHSPGECR